MGTEPVSKTVRTRKGVEIETSAFLRKYAYTMTMDLKLKEMAFRKRFNVPNGEEVPIEVLLYIPLEQPKLTAKELEWGKKIAARVAK